VGEIRIGARDPDLIDLRLRRGRTLNIDHQVTFVVFVMIRHALLLLMDNSTWILY
jgi:hypothetical protein